MAFNKVVEDALWGNPLLLLAIKDEQVIQEINELVPYSTAFEIECMYGPTYNIENFKAIPDIMSVTNDSGEQRYRIPNGLKGIICLFNISFQLKANSLVNPLSGIHYHVDCTDCYKELFELLNYDWKTKDNSAVQETVENILRELDTWLEPGETYTENSRQIGSWFRTAYEHKTVEFRMGEMTFDYDLLLKRIIHCNKIIRELKVKVNPSHKPEFELVDGRKVFNYANAVMAGWKNTRLEKLMRYMDKFKPVEEKEVVPEPTNNIDNMRAMIQRRSHNI